MRGLKDTYTDRLTLTVVEGSFEDISGKAKPYGIGSHGLVGLVGDSIEARKPGHEWGTTPEEARVVIQKHIETLLASKQ